MPNFPQINISGAAIAPQLSYPLMALQSQNEYLRGLFGGQAALAEQQQQEYKNMLDWLRTQSELQRTNIEQQRASAEISAKEKDEAWKTVEQMAKAYGAAAPQVPGWSDAWQKATGQPWPTVTQQTAVPATSTPSGEPTGGGRAYTEGGYPPETAVATETRTVPMPYGGLPTGLAAMTPRQLGIDPSRVPPALYDTPLGQIQQALGPTEGPKFVGSLLSAPAATPKTVQEVQAHVLQKWTSGQELTPQEQAILQTTLGKMEKDATPVFNEQELRTTLLTQGEAFISRFPPDVQQNLRAYRDKLIAPPASVQTEIRNVQTNYNKALVNYNKALTEFRTAYQNAITAYKASKHPGVDMFTYVTNDPNVQRARNNMLGARAALEVWQKERERLGQAQATGPRQISARTLHLIASKLQAGEDIKAPNGQVLIPHINPATGKPWTYPELVEKATADGYTIVP